LTKKSKNNPMQSRPLKTLANLASFCQNTLCTRFRFDPAQRPETGFHLFALLGPLTLGKADTQPAAVFANEFDTGPFECLA